MVGHENVDSLKDKPTKKWDEAPVDKVSSMY